MPTYKLYYFNAKGFAESTRTIFKQAGVEFEDHRFNREEWLASFKAKSPYGVAPWLEVDDGNGVRRIGGSLVISRFVAERVGLAGSNDVDNAELAGLADFFSDFRREGYKAVFIKDQAEKEKAIKEFCDTCSKWLSVFENRIKENPSGWIFGDKLTWVDILVSGGVAFFFSSESVYPPELLAANYPNISTLIEKVESQPNIAKWIKERPQT